MRARVRRGARVHDRLARAGVAWFTTTRPEGGPRITPLVFVWHEGVPWLCTGPDGGTTTTRILLRPLFRTWDVAWVRHVRT
jgi:hypothetical protein